MYRGICLDEDGAIRDVGCVARDDDAWCGDGAVLTILPCPLTSTLITLVPMPKVPLLEPRDPAPSVRGPWRTGRTPRVGPTGSGWSIGASSKCKDALYIITLSAF